MDHSRTDLGVMDIGSGAGLALALQELLMPDHDVIVIGFSAVGVGALARLAAAIDAPASEEEQPGWADGTSAGGPA